MDHLKTGQFIARRRKEKGMTQLRLAEMLHVTNKAVSKWENGRCLPDAALLIPLCEALGCSLNELLAGEKIAEPERESRFEQNVQGLTMEYQAVARRRSFTIAALAVSVVLLLGMVLAGIYTHLFGESSTIDELNIRWHLSLNSRTKEEYRTSDGWEDRTTFYVFDDPDKTFSFHGMEEGMSPEFEEAVRSQLDALPELDSAYLPDFSHPYRSQYQLIDSPYSYLYCFYDTELHRLYLIEIIR